jgi:hypothetical protein
MPVAAVLEVAFSVRRKFSTATIVFEATSCETPIAAIGLVSKRFRKMLAA